LEAFSYSVSHDLRAPLVNLIGFADLLDSKCNGQMDPLGAKYLARIHEAAFKMSHLIDDMLRLAKVGRQGLRKKQVSLRALVDEVLSELGIDADARKRLDASATELQQERDAVKDLLGPAV